MDVGGLRLEFPVLERAAYLNAGSVGPVPRAAIAAATRSLQDQLVQGRAANAQFESAIELAGQLRGRVAALLGCASGEVALTGATTDGVNAVIGGLDLQPGDEVLTSDEEHPGLLAPLGVARRRHGIEVRVVPFAEIANEVRDSTRLVACSHVSWVNGQVVDTAGLAASPAPVLLDGAQGLGAIPVDVAALGCDYYAASGQKWLCGPVGSGYLYVRKDLIESLEPVVPGYGSVADPLQALDGPPAAGAARFDIGFPASHQTAWALAALDVLEGGGIEVLQERAVGLAAKLADDLSQRGIAVAPRGRSTLVSWKVPDPEAESLRLLEAGFVIRNLPATPYVRASVGGWTSDDELAALVSATSSS